MAPLILASDLVRLPVLTIATQNRVGRVRDVLVDAASGRFEGVTVAIDWLGKAKFAAAQDIISIESVGLTVKSPSDVVELAEVVRAKNVYDSKFRLIGLKVVTSSGKWLGKVSDLVISLPTGHVVKIYIASILSLSDRVIPWEKVIKIDRRGVVVDDDLDFIKAVAAAAPS